MKRKLLTILFASSLIATNVFATNSDIKIIINRNNLSFEQPPVVENGRVLVPVRETFEALGAELQWFPETQKVLATKDSKNISLTIGSNQMYINDETLIELDTPAKILENKTLVPLRAVSEAFDATVQWDENTKTATIENNSSELKIDKLSQNFEIRADDNTVIMKINCDYPSIDNPDDDPIINEFNNTYRKMADEFIETNKKGELADNALEFYNSSLKENYEFRCYEVAETFNVTYNKDKIISLLSSNYLYTGGAHPDHSQTGIVYDLNANKRLELTDILNKTQDEIKQIFIDSFSTIIDENPELYFEDAKETVAKSTDTINFYLSKDGLIFFFNPYDIAPYASGYPSSSIPFNGNETLFKLEAK